MSVTSAESSAAMDRLDAAHALLGVSPKTVTEHFSAMPGKPVSSERPPSAPSSGGLDALAALAAESMEAEEQCVITPNPVSSSSDDDSEAMPPPPPRGRGRQRSCSNPEGMEKWDSLSRGTERRRFVLPTKILEEELAEAKCAIERKEEQDRLLSQSFLRKKKGKITFIDLSRDESAETEAAPEDLLRRARSRLLEDLSEGSISGEKGQLTLPHSLNKYKHVSHAALRSRIPFRRFPLSLIAHPFPSGI